ncbi:MAG TPA: protein kinase [Thermoanaerobaculia bacterium]|jgi:Tol biopolymer transport system component
MALSPGTRLGPYEILAPLGAGGMGEVYRARDERLKRDVAIKVLPASYSQDADRLRRFEQEAQAAGGLNHPNITAVYDIGQHDGAPYVVQELLEGETLRSTLAGGRLSLRKAIDYALQTAHGLAAAHEKGIVHRDLKPENLFVTKDGRIKILDFGLAKLTQTEEGSQVTSLPTAAAGTEPGVVLGTLGYMSPEQVRGRPADARSDIFSFGAILYETLSGKRAFHGDSAADTMSAILREDPPDLSVTNQSISPGLERIVRHCLEKNPEQRFHSAHDLAFDLETLSGVSAPRSVAAEVSPMSWTRRLPLLAGMTLGLAGMAATYFAGKKAGYVSPPSFRQLTFRRGAIASARFAPDGQTILYSARWEGKPVEIFVSRLDTPESRAFGLTETELLSVSPSGEMAVSLARRASIPFTRTGTLARLGMTGGGAPKEILDDIQSADWAPDGSRLAIVRDVGGKNRLEFPVGKVLYETAGWIGHPRLSPRGDEIAFLDHPVRGDDGGSVAIVDVSGKRKRISGAFASIFGLCWSSGEREVWFTGASVGFNRALHAATRSGGVRVLAQGTGGLTIEDVSREGRVLVVQDKARQEVSALPPGAEKERNLSWLDWTLVRGLSSDGRTLLFDESGEGGGRGYSVYVRKTDGSPAVRLGEGSGAGLSPDGRLALSLVGSVFSPTVVLYPVGTGEPKSLPPTGLRIQDASWLPDGKRILLSANEPEHGTQLWVQRIGDPKPRAISPEGYTSFAHAISPDGKFAAVSGPDRRLYLYPIAGGEPTPIPGLDPADIPSGWTADGRSIFVRRRGEVPAKIFLVDPQSGRKEIWKQLTPADPAGVTNVSGLAVTPDGKSYAYTYNRSLADLYVVEGLK